MEGEHFYYGPALLLSLVLGSLAFPTTQETPASFIAPFRLTYTPAHVVRHVTRNVILRCEDEEDTEARLQEISRIRMLKKEEVGWKPVAQLRDNENSPTKEFDVRVNGTIGQNVRDTFLEVTWDLATQDTFGTYVCDVIGFDKDTYASAIELTTEVAVAEENVTAADLLKMLQTMKKELSLIGDQKNHGDADNDFDLQTMRYEMNSLILKIDSLSESVTSMKEDVETYNNHTNLVTELVTGLYFQVQSLEEKANKLYGNVNLINETDARLVKEVSDLKGEILLHGNEIQDLDKTMNDTSKEMGTLENRVGNLTGEIAHLNSLIKRGDTAPIVRNPGPLTSFLTEWPEGHFALLRPKVGCPHDMAFAGKNTWFVEILTASLLNSKNEVEWSVSGGSSNGLSVLSFCEASGAFNTNMWPDGSYCINQYTRFCPQGFQAGRVSFQMVDLSIYFESNTAITISSNSLDFCCRTSSSLGLPIVLPTHSPFLLYRYGGSCQVVRDMSVSHKILSLKSVRLKHL